MKFEQAHTVIRMWYCTTMVFRRLGGTNSSTRVNCGDQGEEIRPHPMIERRCRRLTKSSSLAAPKPPLVAMAKGMAFCGLDRPSKASKKNKAS